MKGNAVILALLFFLTAPPSGFSAANSPPAGDIHNRVKVAFIRNFAHYVAWPENSPATELPVWRIGILGKDSVGEALTHLLAGRMERGRAFEVYQADSLDALAGCQIIYVAHRDAILRRAALVELARQPVLTVGEAPTFLQEGGIIRLQADEHMRMSINLDQARASSLTIPTQMLEVSTEVLENGRVRPVR